MLRLADFAIGPRSRSSLNQWFLFRDPFQLFADLSVGIKQPPDFDADRVGNVLQSCQRRCVHAPLYETDEIDRVIGPFGEFFLGEVRLAPEVGDISSEQAIEWSHGFKCGEVDTRLTLS